MALTLGMELGSDMVSQRSDTLPALQVFPEAQHLSREASMALGVGFDLGRVRDKGHLVPGLL